MYQISGKSLKFDIMVKNDFLKIEDLRLNEFLEKLGILREI